MSDYTTGQRIGAAANQAAKVVGSLFASYADQANVDELVALHDRLTRRFAQNMEAFQIEVEAVPGKLQQELGATPAGPPPVPTAPGAPAAPPVPTAPAAPAAPAAPVAAPPAPGVGASDKAALWEQLGAEARQAGGFPDTWYDNRADKASGKVKKGYPDFKNKANGDLALWISDKETPAWVHSWLGTSS